MISPTELVGIVAIRLPWPLPRVLLCFRVALTDLMDSAGVFSANVTSVDGIALPGWTTGVFVLHVHECVLRLRPLPSVTHNAVLQQRTAIECDLCLNTTKVLPIAAKIGHGIRWAIEFALDAMTPSVWDMMLHSLRHVSSGPIGRRLREDITGVYEMVRRRAGQEATA